MRQFQFMRDPGMLREQGSALLISLLLLVAISVIGLSSLAGTATNEIIASNMHQRSIGFQASESAIRSVWTMKDLLENTPETPLNDPPAQSISMSTEFDQGPVDIEATAKVQYCGENSLPVGHSLSADESSMKLAAQIFNVNGVATIDSTNVNTDHLQRGYIVRPESGRTGNCPAL
ncbi:hypothetical protein Q4485_00655 [Granulosicoccaceae sp. 1_MG-2023]|nr:hypothetical protein [Granulosicoccaceae sp. 1_MG-2023]